MIKVGTMIIYRYSSNVYPVFGIVLEVNEKKHLIFWDDINRIETQSNNFDYNVGGRFFIVNPP